MHIVIPSRRRFLVYDITEHVEYFISAARVTSNVTQEDIGYAILLLVGLILEGRPYYVSQVGIGRGGSGGLMP